VNKFSKTKARRLFRSRKRQVSDMTESASQQIDRHVFRRLTSFADVGRFMVAWLLLLVVLIAGVVYQTRGLSEYYLSTQSVPGGLVSEGIIGTYTNPNPIFASSTIDLSVSRLLFNSILTYDDKGALVNDLAETVTRSQDGLIYTVTLRKGTLWHDGRELKSDDVLYTYRAIQNPDTKSPYNISWQGVKIEAPDDYTVTFTLPSALNSFPLSLTNGIVPEHILSELSFSELRSSDFNVKPIGTGPFQFSKVVRIDDFESVTKRQRIEMIRNDAYFKGRPSLDAFVIYALSSEDDLREYLSSKQIDSAIFNSSPDFTGVSDTFTVSPVPLLAGAYLFFNTAKAPFDNVEFRKAIASAVDTTDVVATLGFPVQKIDSPLLPVHTGYDRAIVQTGYDLALASATLDKLGWVRPDSNSIRAKDGVSLEMTITTLEGSDFSRIAVEIQDRLKSELGVKVNIIAKRPADMQPTLLQHSYELLLYGITLGVDPDVYGYWHSSQAIADRFNLSLYKSDAADRSLEAGRTRPDVSLRAAKYKPFLEAWKADVPAIGLYQPPIFFVGQTKIFNFQPTRLNSTADRFYNVHNWQIQTAKKPIIAED
jgi:peptide/nickel transport system substrate-binding protein